MLFITRSFQSHLSLCYSDDLGWGPQIASGWVSHQKDQVIKGLELSGPSTNLQEGDEGLQIEFYKAPKQ